MRYKLEWFFQYEDEAAEKAASMRARRRQHRLAIQAARLAESLGMTHCLAFVGVKAT
jgi:hypothetical protein